MVQVAAVAFVRNARDVDLRHNSIMVALLSFIVLILPVLLARSSPIAPELATRSSVYNHDQRAHCGFSVRDDVTRFVVKYANAQRWEPSTPVSILQGASLLQQVCTCSSYLVLALLMVSIYRISLPLALSLAQVPPPRTAFIWSFMFQTLSGLVATPPPSSGSVFVPSSLAMCSFYSFSGFMVDRSQAVLRATPQLTAQTLLLRPNL